MAATSSMNAERSIISIKIGIAPTQAAHDASNAPHDGSGGAEVVTEDREKPAARQATRKNRLSQPPLLAPRPPCLPDYYWRRGTYSAGGGPLERPHRFAASVAAHRLVCKRTPPDESLRSKGDLEG
ncbi:hypothetical protein I7I51_04007 [Histoplasma capsulatum]|uniref:Uncharacterized protein n=1 Tax=Ajellomyces capsulatus TaxID=5037 RepID=A0A8A1M9A6_AJECA|nr:predicted protein [Histoplasma mississippiense (nom. inval.)]EDN08043.1 predicted protein [Histoplasma mississippiense (nom. inval.)]QSS61830.1 hypothetical protein I7I51_04007 [Histoplasma capsulatum]